MGKWTDKMYITHSEWSNEYGGLSLGGKARAKNNQQFQRLPFSHCSLSLLPFTDPVCAPNGVIFSKDVILAHLKEHQTNPVTGEALAPSDLVQLHFHKNANGEYHCPITLKVFTDNSHIVANRKSGHVYAYEAIRRLVAKGAQWNDLITEEPFQAEDIITLQNPAEGAGAGRPVEGADEPASRKSGPTGEIRLSGTAQRVLDSLKSSETFTAPSKVDPNPVAAINVRKHGQEKGAAPYNASTRTTGLVAASLTSTAMNVRTETTRELEDEDVYMYRHIKKKGYVRLETNLGELNLEVDADEIPKASHNFIQLVKKNYYDGTTFHRSIKNFMIQGGDPTGTGRGGESIWGKDFEDHFKTNLSHSARGILSMANRGKNTNSSQFFITFAPCTHLDQKHTVFGRLVGGDEVLRRMERVPTDPSSQRPTSEIRIIRAKVFVDPFADWKERHERKLAYGKDTRGEKGEDDRTWLGTKLPSAKGKEATSVATVGKYLKAAAPATTSASTATTNSVQASTSGRAPPPPPQQSKSKTKGRMGFGDFSSW